MTPEDTRRLWTERTKFFSRAQLDASQTDLISEWTKANMEAFGGDHVYAEEGVQITIRRFEPSQERQS